MPEKTDLTEQQKAAVVWLLSLTDEERRAVLRTYCYNCGVNLDGGRCTNCIINAGA